MGHWCPDRRSSRLTPMSDFDASLRHSFAQAPLKYEYDLAVLGIDDAGAAERWLLAEFDDRWSINDPKTQIERAEFFQVPGTRPEDYCERIFEFPGGRAVLAGIRHESGDSSRPFLDLWLNCELRTQADLRVVVGDVLPFYQAFKPQRVSFHLRPDSAFPKKLRGGTDVHSLTMAARLSQVRERPRPEACSQITLIQVDSEGD